MAHWVESHDVGHDEDRLLVVVDSQVFIIVEVMVDLVWWVK